MAITKVNRNFLKLYKRNSLALENCLNLLTRGCMAILYLLEYSFR